MRCHVMPFARALAMTSTGLSFAASPGDGRPLVQVLLTARSSVNDEEVDALGGGRNDIENVRGRARPRSA